MHAVLLLPLVLVVLVQTPKKTYLESPAHADFVHVEAVLLRCLGALDGGKVGKKGALQCTCKKTAMSVHTISKSPRTHLEGPARADVVHVEVELL